jgi:hypothetical protein
MVISWISDEGPGAAHLEDGSADGWGTANQPYLEFIN